MISQSPTLDPKQAGDLAVQEWARLRQAKPRTAGEVFGEIGRDPVKLIPFVSSGAEGAHLYSLWRAAQADEQGAANQEQRDLLLTAAVEQGRDSTWGSKFAGIVTQLPAFAGEFAATAGVYAAGSKLTAKAVEATIKGALTRAVGARATALVTKGAGTLAGATLQTAALPTQVVNSALRVALPRLGLAENEAGDLAATLEGSTQGFLESLPAGFSDALTETVSERTGGIVGGIAAPAMLKIRGLQLAAIKKWVGAEKGRTWGAAVAKLKERTGWHGVLGEFSEERIGAAMRAVNPMLPDTWGEVWPGWEQATAELAGFAVPGAVMAGLSRAGPQTGAPERSDAAPIPSEGAPGAPMPPPPGVPTQPPVVGPQGVAQPPPIEAGAVEPQEPLGATQPGQVSEVNPEAASAPQATAEGRPAPGAGVRAQQKARAGPAALRAPLAGAEEDVAAAGGEERFLASIAGWVQLGQSQPDVLAAVATKPGDKKALKTAQAAAEALGPVGADPRRAAQTAYVYLNRKAKLDAQTAEQMRVAGEVESGGAGVVVPVPAGARNATPGPAPESAAPLNTTPGGAVGSPSSTVEERNLSSAPVEGREEAGTFTQGVPAQMPRGAQIGTDLTGEPIYAKEERGDLKRQQFEQPPETQIDLFAEEGGLFEEQAQARDQGVVAEPEPPKPAKKKAPAKVKGSLVLDPAVHERVLEMENYIGWREKGKQTRLGQMPYVPHAPQFDTGGRPKFQGEEVTMADLGVAVKKYREGQKLTPKDRLIVEWMGELASASMESEATNERVQPDPMRGLDSEGAPFSLGPRSTVRRIRRAVARGYDIEPVLDQLEAEAVKRSTEMADKRHFKERERGVDWLTERLARAKRHGEISEEAHDLSTWFLRKNPDLVKDVGITVRGSTPGDERGDGASGFYNRAAKIVGLIRGSEKPDTFVHEVLHHTEQMLPKSAQRGIEDAWRKELRSAREKATDQKVKTYLTLAETAQSKRLYAAHAAAFEMVSKGEVPLDLYPLLDPSEFWAVNGARIIAERHGSEGWVKAAVQWLKEFLEKVKGFVGLKSDAAVLSGLSEVLSGKGEVRSSMVLSQARARKAFSLGGPIDPVDVEEIDSLRDRAMEAGEKTPIGEEPSRVAMTSVEALERATWRAVREVRAKTTDADRQPNDETWEKAAERVDGDMFGTLEGVLTKINAGGALNAEDTAALDLVIHRLLREADISKDEALKKRVYALRWKFDNVRADVGRSLQIIRDAIAREKTPWQRVSDMVHEHSTDGARKLRDLREEMDKPNTPQSRREKLKELASDVLANEAKKAEQAWTDLETAGYPREMLIDGAFDDAGSQADIFNIVSAAKASNWDKFLEYRYASMLSGPLTQSVNAAGSAANIAYEQFAKRTAEALVNVVARDVNSAQLGELKELFPALVKSLGQSGRLALEAFRTEQPAYDISVYESGGLSPRAVEHAGYQAVGSRLDERKGPAIKGTKGKIVRIPLRAMMAADTFFKSAAAAMETAAQAHRAAKAEGHEGEALQDRIRTIMADKAHPIHFRSYLVARDIAFQGKVGPLTELMFKARTAANFGGRVPLGSMALPFIQTPAAIFKKGLSVPFAPVTLFWKAVTGKYRGNKPGAVSDVAEAALGMGLALAVAFAMTSDDDDLPNITGSRPSDPAERDASYRTIPPYSFRVPFTDLWLSYARVEPLAVSLGTLVDFVNAYNRGVQEGAWDGAVTALGQAGGSIVDQWNDKTYMKTLGDVVDAVTDRRAATSAKLARLTRDTLVTPLIPNLVRQPAWKLDPYLRQSPERKAGDEGSWERTFEALGRHPLTPGLNAPPIRYDVWGNMTKRGEAIMPAWMRGTLGLVLPVQPSKSGKDVHDLDRLILRYNEAVRAKKLGVEAEEYWPEGPAYWVKEGGETSYLSEEEFAALQRESGKFAVRRLMKSNLDFENPDESDAEKIKTALEDGRAHARSILRRERRSVQ